MSFSTKASILLQITLIWMISIRDRTEDCKITNSR